MKAKKKTKCKITENKNLEYYLVFFIKKSKNYLGQVINKALLTFLKLNVSFGKSKNTDFDNKM